MSKILFVFFILTWSFHLSGQELQSDSLGHRLKATTNVHRKVDILNTFAFSRIDYDFENAREVAQRALTMARRAGYSNGVALASSIIGYYHYQTGDYKAARKYYLESAAVTDQDATVRAYTLTLQAILQTTQASYDSAKNNFERAIEMLAAENAPLYQALTYKSYGTLLGIRWQNEKANEYFMMALRIYESERNLFGKATVLLSRSDLAKNRAQYKESEEYASMACEIASELDNAHLQLYCLVQRGEIQFRLGNHVAALQNLLDAVDFLNSKDLPLMLVRVYMDLGDVYDILFENDVALRYYFEALRITEGLSAYREVATNQANIAWVYKNQHNFELAYDFIEDAIRLRARIGDQWGIASAYNTKGVIYFEQDKFSEAEQWLKKSVEIRNTLGQPEGASISYYNLALVFQEQKLFRKALSYQLSNLAIERTMANRNNLAGAFNNLGGLYTSLKMYDSAAYYLSEAERVGREIRSLTLRTDNAFLWSEFHEARGNIREALKWHKMYADLNDSIYDENTANKLAEMNALYHADKKDKEIRLLQQDTLLKRHELQLQGTKIGQQKLIIVSIVIGFILVSALAFKTWQYNQKARRTNEEIMKQKEEMESQSRELQEAYKIIEYINKKLEAKVENKSSALEKAYKELDTFFYRASHDFRRPLTTFLGLAEVAHISVRDPNALELFGKVRDTARYLDKMLLKLQSISDMGSQQMVYEEVNIAGIFHELPDTHREDLESRRISTYTSVVLPGPFYSYPALVHIIIDNLFENAINFSRYDNGVIRLRAFVENGCVVVEVEDNGEGIAPGLHDKIFDMYFRGSERSKGNGLGLYIVRKASERLESNVTFTSQPGQGTTFRVEFKSGPGSR